MLDGTLTTANTGVQLHYRTQGSRSAAARVPGNDQGGRGNKVEKPPLVLVHGLASTLRIWDYVAPLLTRKYWVVAYDQRGHAESEKPDSGYDLSTMLADMQGLMDGLDIQNPVLVGHSWGANLALAYAVTYDNCAGLVMLDGGIHSFQDMPGADWETTKRELAPPDLSRYKLTDMVNRMGSGVLCHLPQSYLEGYARSMMDVQPDGTIRAKLKLDRHLDILRIIYDMRSEELLSKVKCPVLVIQAVDGEPTDERGASFLRMKKLGAERVRQLLPNSHIVRMENTVHDIPLHRPEMLAAEIIEFMRKT